MIKQRLDNFFATRHCTFLGVGPMSKNCVDASIELSNQYEVPLFLIASRRQIECAEMGGGYVNNWSTEEFSKYVFDQDKKGKIILARDHGGPWQNSTEFKEKIGFRKAMESAKKSYAVDIESGFEVIHIDPSVDPYGTPSLDEVLERIYDLYEYCCLVAKRQGRQVLFEIGTEEQSGTTHSKIEEIEYVLNNVMQFCLQNGFPPPTFIVIQTGTRVLETRNVGSFDSPFRIAGELPAEIQVPRMLQLCKKFKIYMKEHNTDYLSDESLSWHPKLGIHAANVAPEFGVEESRSLLYLLRENGLENFANQFLELSYNSKKWEKWLVPNSTISDGDKAIISGHYVFADSRFKEIKDQAQLALNSKGIDIDEFLKDRVKKSILRYLKHFRLANIS